VADDGGSSGKLRRDLGVLPPGDFRNNIVALARDEAMITQLFQYRFGEGGLDGHSFGNLFITAMSEITGSFERALIESSRVLSIRGQVLPSTLIDVSLIADLREYEAEGTRRVIGESLIPTVQGRIERVHLDPENPPAYPDAVKAILSADLIVLGPGSLYTSILPNLLVKGITDALRAALAPVVYICNVAQQAGETDGFSVQDHIRAIESHVGKSVVDIVIANSSFPKVEVLPGETPFTWVQMEQRDQQDPGYQIMEVQLADKQSPWRHDAVMLGKVLIGLLAAERTAL
jgi:uncharacterized cofD-like protein